MLPKNIQNLIDQLSRLPGIGPKTAARLTFYMLSKPDYEIEQFGHAFLDLKADLKVCISCFNISEHEICRICEDKNRDDQIIAIVEEPLDVIALEKSGGFNGKYHVLGGSIDPLNGVGPEQLRILELLDRLKGQDIEEIILATNPDFEGEATAAYIKEKVSNINAVLRITRIARGLPVGGDLEYADEVTLKRSLEGRREYL